MEKKSCDIFVIFPPLTSHGGILFGKNSNRPKGEVQELIYVPGNENGSGTKLECTYITIDQAPKTHAVILSKPAWTWGAEMGSNDKGVCIGNVPIINSFVEPNTKEELLGVDLVRLGLERASTADEAVTVISQLLEQHGQGGKCSDTEESYYHNSFVIVDTKEAWIFETAGKLWAAEKIEGEHRHITNTFTVTTKIDRKSESLFSEAQKANLWDGQGDFDFAKAFGKMNESKSEILSKYVDGKKCQFADMLQLLRNKDFEVCLDKSNKWMTAGSQISMLAPNGSEKPCCHWFTATPDPSISVFKPFVFTPNVHISSHTKSPVPDVDPTKVVPRFSTTVDRRHVLYKYHQDATNGENANHDQIISKLRSMEAGCVSEMEAFLSSFEPGQSLSEIDEILKDVVETEVKFYK